MEKRVRILLTFVFVVVLVTSLYLLTNWFSKITGYLGGEAEKEKLAQCLSEKNAEFYSSIMCPDCEKQKTEFGKAISAIRVVNCGQKGEACLNIKSTPAWYLNKRIYYGYMNLTELDNLSGCNVLGD